MPAQLPPSFKEPNFRKFPNKSGHNCRITGTEAALAEEADRERSLRKIQREREIKDRYEAELAALEVESPDDTPKNKSLMQDLSPTIRPLSPIHITSDSDQECPVNAPEIPALSEPGPFLAQRSPSPLLRQSGRNRKLTQKAESQQRREAERENLSEPKKKKIKKSKRVGLTSQLREILGSNIEI